MHHRNVHRQRKNDARGVVLLSFWRIFWILGRLRERPQFVVIYSIVQLKTIPRENQSNIRVDVNFTLLATGKPEIKII